MQIIIKTKNLEFTPSLDLLIKKRMSGFNKFIDIVKNENYEIFLEIKKETEHHKKGEVFFTEAIVRVPGKKLVARVWGENLEKTITAVKKELSEELKKYKSQKIEEPRRNQRKFEKIV